MSAQPTYEELTASVNDMKTQLAGYKTQLDTFTATKKADDDDDKKQEASFKKAMKDMDEHTKDATEDMDKVKDVFKRANDEDDPEKKKEAMKKAIHDKDDYMNKKSAKKAQDEPAPKDDKEKDAKIAHLEDKHKIPIMQKILQATKIIDPSNYDKVEKELTAATLEQVECKYASLAPYIASVGLSDQSTIPEGTMGMIPFQASAATGEQGNSTNVFEGSVETIDFSKVKTSDIEAIQ